MGRVGRGRGFMHHGRCLCMGVTRCLCCQRGGRKKRQGEGERGRGRGEKEDGTRKYEWTRRDRRWGVIETKEGEKEGKKGKEGAGRTG